MLAKSVAFGSSRHRFIKGGGLDAKRKLTSPIDFRYQNRVAYANAIARTIHNDVEIEICWHQTFGENGTHSMPTVQISDRVSQCVQIPATFSDIITELLSTKPSSQMMSRFADSDIIQDGQTGVVVEPVHSGDLFVSILMHWPALYTNGRFLKEVLTRMEKTLSNQIHWQSPLEIAHNAISNHQLMEENDAE